MLALGQQTGGRPLGSSFRRPRTHTLVGNRLPFLALRWFFHVLAPWAKGGGALFSSWIISCIIFTNKFQENHVMLTEREKGQSPLAIGVGQHLVAPRPQALVEASGCEGGHMSSTKTVCCGQLSQGLRRRGSKITFLCAPEYHTAWLALLLPLSAS